MIEFHELRIVNFSLWRDLTLSLHNQGIVCIRGLNGAGKSSIFRSIYYCIYGKTSEGFKVSELTTNKKPCFVRLDFTHNGHKYRLVRFRNHKEYGNKVFLKGYGIPQTDEDSLVGDVQNHIQRLFGIADTTFLTTVYFSQRNFNTFNLLSDVNKKEFLERLTYGSLFSRCEELARARVRKTESDIGYYEGALQGLTMSLTNLQEEKKQVDSANKKRLMQLGNARAIILEHIRDIKKSIEDYDAKIMHVRGFVNEYEMRCDEIANVRKQINQVAQLHGTCYACFSAITKDYKNTIIADLERTLVWKHKRYRLCKKYYDETMDFENHKHDLQESLRSLRQEEAVIATQVKSVKTSYNKELLTRLQGQISKIQADIVQCKHQLEYNKYWVKSFSFSGLRSIVLGQVIQQVGDFTNRYLHQVARHHIDSLSLQFVNTKLVSDFSGRSYNTLSGGEKQLVDLCTGLAIREAAELHNKAKFNLIIFDEPFTWLDKVYQAGAQDLLFSIAKPSTFVIMHESIEMQFDHVYEVEKRRGESQLKIVY